jgi:hypothetical protein
MREAINNNPIAQAGLLAALALLGGLLFMMNMKGGSSSSSSTASSTAPPAASSSPSAGGSMVTPGSSTGAATGTAGTAPTTTGTVNPSALVPGPGLPKPVIAAWKRGDTVVLLIARQGGIDDRLVRGAVRSLSGDSSVSVFVTRANKVARYSRITQGVGVTQAPALVVVRPKRLTGSVPEAQVDYGFRDSQGVVQAVHDAVYSGKDNLPYSPR